MKPKILKLLTIVLLLLFFGARCQKEEWETIELSEDGCDNSIGVLNSITDYTGTINIHPESIGKSYYIFIDTPEDMTGAAFLPCNLPNEYHQKGLKIIFSGQVLNVQDWMDGNQSDFLGTPIKLTNAKIKNK